MTTVVKTLSGEIFHFIDLDEMEIKSKLASQFQVPVQRVCLTAHESGTDSIFLLIQPPAHPYGEEFMTYLYNFKSYLQDHIFDHLDLMDTTTHHILPPISTFQCDWSNYFEQFDRFFADPSDFHAFSVVQYKNGIGISALEYLISFYLDYAHSSQEPWLGMVRRQINTMLSVTDSTAQLETMYTGLIQEATSQNLHTQEIMYMALPMYAELMKALRTYLPSPPPLPTRFHSMDEVSERIRKEHQIEWTSDDLMDLLSFYVHFEFSNI